MFQLVKIAQETHFVFWEKCDIIYYMNFRQSLFWDTDPKRINVKKNASYIIERVLDFGTDQEVRWLRKAYNPKLIKKIVSNSRSLNPKTKNLWLLLLKK